MALRLPTRGFEALQPAQNDHIMCFRFSQGFLLVSSISRICNLQDLLASPVIRHQSGGWQLYRPLPCAKRNKNPLCICKINLWGIVVSDY